MSAFTVGVDVGTGSAKAVVFDPELGVLGRGEAGYRTHYPRDGWAEQDPEDWWTAAGGAVRTALAAAEFSPADVSAVGFSGMGGATVLVDDAGRPAAPGVINLDRRAVEEQAALRSGSFARAVRAASGNDVGAWNVAAKTRWFMVNRPAQFHRTRTITSPAGYLLLRSTGEPVQSVSDAGIFDVFDLPTRTWSAAACDALGISPDLLPRVAGSMERIGHLLPSAADDLGLTTRCVVVAGAEDTAAAALAAGAVHPATGYVSLGTAGVVGVVTDPDTAPQPRVLRFPHVTHGRDLLAGSMSAAGAAMRWLSAVTGMDVPRLLRQAEETPAGANGVVFLPYLAGELHPVNDPEARAIFAGLSIDTTPAHLARAVIEGSANAVAHNLEVITEVALSPSILRATGRPTESGAWCRSISDATGVTVETVRSDGAPLGSAMLAAATTEPALHDLASRHAVVRNRYVSDPAQLAPARRRRELTAALYRTARG